MQNQLYIKEIESTNMFMRKILSSETKAEGFVVVTDFQTAGKGQGKNSWESEKSKNLLFSMYLKPEHIIASDQFIISQIVSVAISNVISGYCEKVKVKWPNDIYAGDKKLAGILIENVLTGSKISRTIIGIGLNVNQQTFISDAPNPVSLKQITGRSYNRQILLKKIVQRIWSLYESDGYEQIQKDYFNKLYRNDGFYPFRTENEVFMAKIKNILPDGRMLLKLEDDSERIYGFKETEFVITP